jgi:hypothetical protein
MSLLFIHGGWGKLLAPAATQAMLASHHLPMVKLGWILAVVVELGGGLAILFGLFTRPVGLVLAIWCVATALIAHSNFRRSQSGDPFFEKHGDDGRVSLRRGVRRRRLESRRTVVAPRSLTAADPTVAALPAASAPHRLSAEPCTWPSSCLAIRHKIIEGTESQGRQAGGCGCETDEHRPVQLPSTVPPLNRALHPDGYPERRRVGASSDRGPRVRIRLPVGNQPHKYQLLMRKLISV